MFLVFNRQKIYSYLVALTTVAVLLGVAKIYTNKSSEIVDTFSKAREVVERNVSSDDKNNSIILEENWTDNDVFQILQILKKYNVCMNFYITKNWKNNHNASVNQISNYGHKIIEIEENRSE